MTVEEYEDAKEETTKAELGKLFSSREYNQMKNMKGNNMEYWNWQVKERVLAQDGGSSKKQSPGKNGHFKEPFDIDENIEKVLDKMDEELHEEVVKGKRVRFNMNSAKTNDTDNKFNSLSD